MYRVKGLPITLLVCALFYNCSKSSLTKVEQDLVAKELRKNNPDETVFIELDKPPEIVGGISALIKNVIYPKEAIDNKIEGKVIILCTITKDGIAKDPKIIQGLEYGCNEAAIQAVLKTKYIPGEYKNRIVETQLTIPISFKLH